MADRDFNDFVLLLTAVGHAVVPDVIGMSEQDANSTIEAVEGLSVGTVTYGYSDTIAAGFVTDQDPNGGTNVIAGTEVDLVVSLGQPVVPDVTGQNLTDAGNALAAVTLVTGTVTYQYSDTVAAGLVISSSPAAGTSVPIGSSVDLVLSLGQPVVPDVTGMTLASASAAITAVDNLVVGSTSSVHSDTIPAGNIISQSPAGGTAVTIGSSVDLVISIGLPVIPDVTGQPQATAEAAILSATFTVGTVTTSNKAP